MTKKLIRLAVCMVALVIAALGNASLGAKTVPLNCLNVAPFCASACSCGPMRCSASCDQGCAPWIEEANGPLTVWCDNV